MKLLAISLLSLFVLSADACERFVSLKEKVVASDFIFIGTVTNVYRGEINTEDRTQRTEITFDLHEVFLGNPVNEVKITAYASSYRVGKALHISTAGFRNYNLEGHTYIVYAKKYDEKLYLARTSGQFMEQLHETNKIVQVVDKKTPASQRLSELKIMISKVYSAHTGEPMIVAHRGASRDAPENTLTAFKLAWEQGADAIEGDFHLTKDGHIVCIHDRNTKNVSNTNLVVRESTLAELRALDVGAHFGEAFTGTRIPTLAEVFATIPDQKTIYIEIKCGTEIIPALLEEIKKSGLKREQIVVISFNQKVIQELKATAPKFKASWLSVFKKDESGAISPSLETVLTTLEKIKADGFSSTKILIDEGFVRSIIKKGYEYHVWTVDDTTTATRFKKWGAKSITTNIPDDIKRTL